MLHSENIVHSLKQFTISKYANIGELLPSNWKQVLHVGYIWRAKYPKAIHLGRPNVECSLFSSFINSTRQHLCALAVYSPKLYMLFCISGSYDSLWLIFWRLDTCSPTPSRIRNEHVSVCVDQFVIFPHANQSLHRKNSWTNTIHGMISNICLNTEFEFTSLTRCGWSFFPLN